MGVKIYNFLKFLSLSTVNNSLVIQFWSSSSLSESLPHYLLNKDVDAWVMRCIDTMMVVIMSDCCGTAVLDWVKKLDMVALDG